MKITIDLEGWTEEQLADYVATKALERLANDSEGNTVERQIRTRIERHIDKTLTEYTEQRIREELDAVIAEAWPETNRYGEPTGQRVTFRQRVSAMLDARDYDQRSQRERMIKEAVDASFSKVFKEEIEKARAAFRAQVDDVLKAKLQESLRASLGLGQ